jgi:adenylyltransferase/sulfurtransferase
MHRARGKEEELLNVSCITSSMQSKYIRQRIVLGEQSDTTLMKKTVAIIGCGALGSAVAHLLVRMGVGNFILIDGDTVEIHNLARQHLYTEEDVGKKKVEALKSHLLAINSQAKIQTQAKYITSAKELALSCDLFIDGLDTHAIRRYIDTYCATHDCWWVHGAAIQEKGTVIALNGKDRSYADIYPEHATDTHCADSGVLATTTTMVASIQTRIALQVLLGEQVPFQLIRVAGISVTTYPIK